jgi:endonuclease-8
VPEGHTIHRLARDLRSTLRGAPVRVSSPQGRFEAGAAALDGRQLERADAWGKYLFCDFGTGEVLHVHLGLIGKFRQRPSPPPDPTGAVRLRLEGEHATWDLSGPTRCELISPDEQARIVGRLGADPLRRDADVAAARERIARSSTPIGTLVLDQSVIAGIGNVYRAELLFLCGIHPAREARSLTDDELGELWTRAVELLRVGVRLGRIVTTEPDEIGRSRGRMRDDERLYVYHREICRRCGTEIATLVLGGRPIWFCPTCQPSPEGHAPRHRRSTKLQSAPPSARPADP